MKASSPLAATASTAALVLVLALVAAVAPPPATEAKAAHSYAHSVVGQNSTGLCFKLEYDQIFVEYTSTSINASASEPAKSAVQCFSFTNITGQAGKCALSAQVSFDLVVVNTTIGVGLSFDQNATYNCSTPTPTLLSGDQSNALSEIEVTIKHESLTTLTFASMGDYDLAMDKNTSYECSYNFTYTTNQTVPALPKDAKNATFTIRNIHVQPFIAQEATNFAPTNDDSYCPRDDSAIKRIGLIVGGALTGVALLGIILFAVSTCRNKGYERISN